MGQRHQLFVIARVQSQYRCVAAFHSQYLYGRLVVHAAARLMRAFLNPFNAAAIETELSTLKLVDIDSVEDDMSQEDPTVICPYLTGLFVTSCRVDMDRFQLYRLSLESIHVQPCRFNNDDGYTCFDLTEPGAPRYCFWWSGRGPVTALGYLGQDDPSKPQVDLSAVALLDRHALVDVSALGATFPDEFRHLRGLSVVDDPNVDDIPPAVPTSLSALSVISALRAFLSSDGQELESDDALATLADLIIEQNHLAVLRSDTGRNLDFSEALQSDQTCKLRKICRKS